MSFKNYLGVNYEHSTKEELVELCKAMIIAEELSGAEIDTLRKLWDKGPLEVGDVPSKQGVFDLIDRGLVSQWSNQKGNYYGVVTGLGATVYRALNYLGNIQSLPILRSPVTVDIQSDLTPYTKSSVQNSFWVEYVKINREIAEKQVGSHNQTNRESLVDGDQYPCEELWIEDESSSISYLNLLTVKDAIEFVEWLNGHRKTAATANHVFVDLGVWNIIYPDTIAADYRLSNVGQRFKENLLRKIVVDKGVHHTTNARYGLIVHVSGNYDPNSTLLQHLKTLSTDPNSTLFQHFKTLNTFK